MASEEMILIFFVNLSFRLPWQPIKFNGLDKNHMIGRGLLKEQLCKTFVKIICNETAIKAYFHFYHYKSMESLGCHSNEST